LNTKEKKVLESKGMSSLVKNNLFKSEYKEIGNDSKNVIEIENDLFEDENIGDDLWEEIKLKYLEL